jgi:hypothetical protein
VVVLVDSFGRKRVFRVKYRCLSVFANKWLCEVLEIDFCGGWNLNFSVDYDRAKCQEHVGENGIENGLTVWILRAKTWNLENLILSVRQPSYYDFWHRTTILTRFRVFRHWKNYTTMEKNHTMILHDHKLLKCTFFNQIVFKPIPKCRNFILII